MMRKTAANLGHRAVDRGIVQPQSPEVVREQLDKIMHTKINADSTKLSGEEVKFDLV